MKKSKKVVALLICLMIIMTISSMTAYANVDEEKFIEAQMDDLKKGLDYEQLKMDAFYGVEDLEVPKDVSSRMTIEGEFIPIEGVETDFLDSKTYSTVQKLGEVTSLNGETMNVYVALSGVEAVNSTERTDTDFATFMLSTKVWVRLIWIDHFGVDNEIDEVQAEFDYGNYDCSDKLVEYGEVAVGNTSNWLQRWAYSPRINNPVYSNRGVIGFKLAASASMYVPGHGTIKATAMSSGLDIL